MQVDPRWKEVALHADAERGVIDRQDADTDVWPMRAVISSLRRKLGDNAEDPTYIFTELRVGYRMPKGEEPKREEP